MTGDLFWMQTKTHETYQWWSSHHFVLGNLEAVVSVTCFLFLEIHAATPVCEPGLMLHLPHPTQQELCETIMGLITSATEEFYISTKYLNLSVEETSTYWLLRYYIRRCKKENERKTRKANSLYTFSTGCTSSFLSWIRFLETAVSKIKTHKKLLSLFFQLLWSSKQF